MFFFHFLGGGLGGGLGREGGNSLFFCSFSSLLSGFLHGGNFFSDAGYPPPPPPREMGL